MTNLNFTITNQTISRTDTEEITADSDNFLKCYFTFTGTMWEQGVKYIIFASGSESYIQTLHSDESGIWCYLPDYCNKFPFFTVGAAGCHFNTDGTLAQYYTDICEVWLNSSCKAVCANLGDIPTQYNAIMAAIAEFQAQLQQIEVDAGLDEAAVNALITNAVTALNLNGTYSGISHTHDSYVEKVSGKGLSSNDFTNEDKQKLDSITSKADKVTGAVSGNFAALNSAGNLSDSNYKPSDFALASHNHDAAYSAINHKHNALYADINHNHDSAYAPLSHTHNDKADKIIIITITDTSQNSIALQNLTEYRFKPLYLTSDITGCSGVTAVNVNDSDFLNVLSGVGTYSFTYDGTNWTLNNTTVNLVSYGISVVTGEPAENDVITVDVKDSMDSISLYFPSSYDPDYISSVVFKSGTAATSISYPAGVKWSGNDIVNSQFVPALNTVYDIIFYYDGFYINGVVRGVRL